MEQKKVREFQSFQLIETNNEKYYIHIKDKKYCHYLKTGDEC